MSKIENKYSTKKNSEQKMFGLTNFQPTNFTKKKVKLNHLSPKTNVDVKKVL